MIEFLRQFGCSNMVEYIKKCSETPIPDDYFGGIDELDYDIQSIKKFCTEARITEEQFYGRDIIKGNLNLDGFDTIPDGFSPRLVGNLVVNSITRVPLWFKPIVNGNMYMNHVTCIPRCFEPVVVGDLELHRVKSIPAEFKPVVGRDLIFLSLEYIPIGFSPVVGKRLSIGRSRDVPETFDPIVPFLNFGGMDMTFKSRLPSNYLFSWRDGKYVKVGGIFTEVVNRDGDVYQVRMLNGDDLFYLVGDGNGNYAHGRTLEEAKYYLFFNVGDRTKYDYENLKPTDVLSYEECVKCYRVVTGASIQWAIHFAENRLVRRSEDYTIAEMIELSSGLYGSDLLKEFFGV